MPRGGVPGQRRHATRSWLDGYLMFDVPRLFAASPDAWDLTLLTDGYGFVGRDFTPSVGGVQVVSNIDGPARWQLAELWVETRVRPATRVGVRLKLGKVEANSEFAYLDEAMVFAHSTPGFAPTIVGMPSYPDPATAALAEVRLGAARGLRALVRLAVFDGALAQGIATGPRGPETFFRVGEDAAHIALGQADVRWPALGGLGGGHAAAGGFAHTARFERLDDGTQSGTRGGWVLAEQQLPAGLAVAGSFGWADAAVSPVAQSWFLGATWTGACASRPDDVLAVGVSLAVLSDVGDAAPPGDETAWELQYRAQAWRGLTVAPVLHVIDTPSGADTRAAWLATLRVVARL